jgi:hypothetical protein
MWVVKNMNTEQRKKLDEAWVEYYDENGNDITDIVQEEKTR